MSKPQLRLIEASFHERPVTLRLPFRFGVVTLTEAPQAFVRARPMAAKAKAFPPNSWCRNGSTSRRL
jgi:hypothetical protein